MRVHWPPTSFSGYLRDRKSTRLNSSHVEISYAVFCLKKKKKDDCDALVTELKKTFQHLKMFSDVYLQLIGKGDCTNEQFDIIFNVDMPVFFFNDTATTEIYTLSLHDALPI